MSEIDEKDDESTCLVDECCTDIGMLPDEILEFILSYLPPYRDLEECSLVCKRWQAAVKNLIRRSKMNLHKGLLDFRLRWEVFNAHTSTATGASNATATLEAMNATSNSASSFSIIAGRFSHSAVRHGNYMFIFGGGSSTDTTFNDLWRFDLSEMRWERPLSMGSYPSPKGSASMVYWREQLVLFGGWRYPSLHPPYQPWCLFDELHYYDLATNRWTVHVALPSPPPMAGHSASVHGDRMVIFGGYQIDDSINSNSNEVWCLDLIERKWWQPYIAGNTKPPPRYGQYQLELDQHHLLVMGGCGGPNSVYSDVWLLDMSRDDHWIWQSMPVRNKKYGATHMWCNPACKVGSKLVVLGPTPNMPQDFQMMRQTRMPPRGNTGQHLGGGALPNNRYDRPRQLAVDGYAVGGGAGLHLPAMHGNRLENYRLGARAGVRGGGGVPAAANGPPDDQYYANRRAILNQHQHQQNMNHNFLNHTNNNNGNGNSGGVSMQNYANMHSNSSNNNFQSSQPRCGRLGDLHTNNSAATSASAASNAEAELNQNRPSSSTMRGSGLTPAVSSASDSNAITHNGAAASNGNGVSSSSNSGNNELDRLNRLQRNLALRCRENEPLLPKRFDELYEDPFRMAAFNVQSRSPRSQSKDHNERIRRMEEKMNALRNSRRNAVAVAVNEPKVSAAANVKEPSPKRVKRNVFSLFVCDLSAALRASDAHVEWIEYKNGGVLAGAPERLILSSMVAGNGELILFGGVHKETLGEITHQVSNSVHFLGAMRDIV